ncbi:MAG: orotate phosphoribosyltransferase [Nocardioides sp.]
MTDSVAELRPGRRHRCLLPADRRVHAALGTAGDGVLRQVPLRVRPRPARAGRRPDGRAGPGGDRAARRPGARRRADRDGGECAHRAPALFVRKQAKEYGTCKLAEGLPSPAGESRSSRMSSPPGARCGTRPALCGTAGAVVEVVVCAIDRSPDGENPLADVGLEVRAVLTKAELDAARG